MASNANVLSGDSSDQDLDYDSIAHDAEEERRKVCKLVPVKTAPPTGGVRAPEPLLPRTVWHPCVVKKTFGTITLVCEDKLSYRRAEENLTVTILEERNQCFNANIEHPDVADMRIIERDCLGFVFLSHDNKPKVDHLFGHTPNEKYLKSLEQRVYILETTVVRKNSDSIERYYVAVPHTLYPTCCASTDLAISNYLVREGEVAKAFQTPPRCGLCAELTSGMGHRICADVHNLITGKQEVSYVPGDGVPLSLDITREFLQKGARKFQNELMETLLNVAEKHRTLRIYFDNQIDRIKKLEKERDRLKEKFDHYAHQEQQLRDNFSKAKRKCDDLQGQLHDEQKRTQACEDMYGQLANELEPALKRLHAKYSDDEDVKAFQAAASQVLHACSPCAICTDITKTQDLVHFDCQCSTAVCEKCIVQLAGVASRFKCLTCQATSLHPKTKESIQDTCISLTTG